MKVAIIEPESGQRDVYKDILESYDIDLFDSPYKFTQVDSGLYDVILIAHRFGDESWLDTYRSLRNAPRVIVTATYPKDYYKREQAINLWPAIQKINDYPNVIFFQKSDFKNIVRALNIEEVAKSSQ